MDTSVILLEIKLFFEAALEWLCVALRAFKSIGEMCVVFIGIYTFYRTFLTKKIKFLGFGVSSETWEGYSFSVNIQNFSLSALSIDKIELIIGDKQKATLRKYREPFILEPLKAIKIESKKNSESPFLNDYVFDQKLKLAVHCSNGKVLIVKQKKLKWLRRSYNTEKYEYKTIFNKTFDGILVTDSMKYAIDIFGSDGTKRRTFLTNTGIIKDAINGYNAIPGELVHDEDKVVQILEELLGKGYKVVIQDISLYSEKKEQSCFNDEICQEEGESTNEVSF